MRTGSDIRRRILLLAALWCWTVALAHGQTTTQLAGEYQIKAAFLFNFAKFVKWPESALPEAATSIAVCVLSDEDVARTIEETIGGKTVRDKRVVVTRLTTAEPDASCQMLFVSGDQAAKADKFFGTLAEASVLTVGETEDFAARGGVMNFRMETNKIRFDVNADAAKRAHLELSSQLLKLATIVHDGRPRQ